LNETRRSIESEPSNTVSTFLHHRRQKLARGAFTLTELLVVIAVLALLVAVRPPALCRTKAPVQLIQCLSNCRQIGLAALLYRADNNDAYPFGNRVYGPGTGANSVVDPTGWPMQLLPYLGGYQNDQPPVFVCPSETQVAENWVFQLHYQANRLWVTDVNDTAQPVRGAQRRNPAIYWLFMEKGPWDYANVRPGGLLNPLLVWNSPPGSPQYRRHSGGLSAAAADGHVDWLRTPPYQPGRPAPDNFLELGDCSNGGNPANSWRDDPARVKLYCRERQAGFE
jgi:prepilin-type N-terminal cleavage/methylation domain-containing protein/prepilin-type processing-associated H-X9-DG protein